MAQTLYAILPRHNKVNGLRIMPVRYGVGVLPIAATILACLLILPGPRIALADTNAEANTICPDRRSERRRQHNQEKTARLLGTKAPPPATEVAAPTFLRAEEIESLGQSRYRATGDVEIVRSGQRLTSDELTYDRDTDVAQSPGPAIFENDLGDRFNTSSLQLTLSSHTGEGGATRYWLASDLGHGDASAVVFEDQDHTRLRDTHFTTCPAGRDDWFLKASELELDQAEDLGTAWHSTLEFKGVPVFYFPYVSFPISDRRRSGFLFPEVGNSSTNGFTLATPYYINIAPSMDDTLVPRYMSQRGLQLDNEFRYLLHGGGGTLEAAYLPDDDQTQTDRSAWKYNHHNTFNEHWSARVNAQRVSDNNYLDDFGGSLATTSQSVLQQSGQIDFAARYWRFTGEATNFQVVDPDLAKTDYPYRMLPNLMLQGDPVLRPNTVNLPTRVQWTNFDRDTGVTGKRSYVNPAISVPLRTSYGFVTPKVLGWYMGYDLDHTTGDTTPSQSVSGLSLDSGLFFDRKTQWFGQDFAQTFEPRLFYATIPYKDQNDLPVFDTDLRDISFPALFQENRFTGGDRVGDTQQLSVGLSTRFIDRELGRERLRLSIGESFYFSDRRVGIPTDPGPQTDDKSGVVTEATAWMGGSWYSRATLVTEPESWTNDQGTLALQYNPRFDRIVALGYSYERNGIEQVNSGIEWPIGGPWRVRAAQAYSIAEKENIDTYAGLAYNNCCWAFRIYARHRRLTDGDQEDSVMLQFEFVGLSKIGDAPKSPLDASFFYSTRLLPGSGPSTLQD